MITAGVFAASGEPILPLVILAAAAGAFAGDHVAYLARPHRGRPARRARRQGTRKRKALRLGRPASWTPAAG